MEAWDLYDIDRNKTGKIGYRGEPLAQGQYHLAVDIWIINSDGEVLLQKRSSKKEAGAGLWCCTGGAAIAGEDSKQTCQREAAEELGIMPDMKLAQMILQHTMGNCHKDVWLIHQDISPDAFHLQREEVDDVRWVTMKQLKRELENPSLFWIWKLHYMDSILKYLNEAVSLKGKEDV